MLLPDSALPIINCRYLRTCDQLDAFRIISVPFALIGNGDAHLQLLNLVFEHLRRFIANTVHE